MTREELVSEKESLKLAVDIACAAREDDIMELVKSLLDKHGFSEKLCMEPVHSSGLAYPTVRINKRSSNCTLFNIEFERDCSTGLIKTAIVPRSFDYYPIRQNTEDSIVGLNAINMMVNSLKMFDEHVNLPEFRSYENDIIAYENSISNIKKFDNEAMKARLQEIESSFIAGMKIQSRKRFYPILKVTRKKVVLSGYTYDNGQPRKSEWKDVAAQRIYNGTWTLVA